MATIFRFLSSVTPTSSDASSASSASGGSGSSFSWETIWNTITNYFQSNAWNILFWFATLVIGVIFIYIVVRLFRLIMRKRGVDEMAVRFLSRIIKFALWTFLVLILLALMGVPITGLTTAVSAAILAIGMALRDFLSHLAAGIILIGSRNYKKGDCIQINGLEGAIVDINFLFTTVRTYDSTRVTIPNSMMVNSCVTNLHALGMRRLALHFPVAHDADLDLAKKTLLEVMHSDGRIKLDPVPTCRLSGINQNYLDLLCLCHVDYEDYWDIYFYIWDQGYDALKRVGIHTPYQRVSVYQGQDKEEFPISHPELPTRVEKKPKDDEIRHLSLVDYDELTPEQVAEIMVHNKKVREKKKAQKEKEKAKKAEGKKQAKK